MKPLAFFFSAAFKDPVKRASFKLERDPVDFKVLPSLDFLLALHESCLIAVIVTVSKHGQTSKLPFFRFTFLQEIM